MENNNSPKKYNLVESPWYFGAYLNMARHNVYLLINHLTQKFNYLQYQKINNDEDIGSGKHILANIFDVKQKVNNEERYKVYKYLAKRHYLPFIKIFHEKCGYQLDKNPIVRYDELHLFINSVFRLLTAFRNSYSHYLAIDNNGEKIEDRNNFTDVLVKNEIIKLFQKAPEFSLKRFEKTQEEKDYNHLGNYQLFKDDTTELTEQGFYFFINLFLERSYAIKFLKKISGFKNESTPLFRATIQAFTAYSLKVPDVRLDNDDRKFSLLLEMLNELQRCPKELYNHLNEEDQKKFEPKIEDKGKSNILLNSTDYSLVKDDDIDDLLSEITSLRRGENRFPYFALRFIDEFDLLPNIRFQITIGKLQIRHYDKTIANEKVNRRVTKTINAYGKLSDFEKRENETLIALTKGIKDKGPICFEQFAPHYNLTNNKIPFYLFEDLKNESKIKYPDPLRDKKENESSHNKPSGYISLNDLPKLALLAYFKKDEVERLIKAFIAKNFNIVLNIKQLEKIRNQLSLEPKEFTRRFVKENLIRRGNGVQYLDKGIESELLDKYQLSLEELIKLPSDILKGKIKNTKYKEYADQIRYINYLNVRRQALQKYLPNGILVNQLPKQVLNYLLNISGVSSDKLVHQKIRAIKSDCKLRLNRLEKELEKNKSEQNLKLGELATFLARDIIDMVIDEGVKKKITSPYYQKLQNKIAYFSISKNEIIDLCQELNLFKSREGHVFLSKELIETSKGVSEFYQKYLTTKKKWIEDNLFIKGHRGGYFIPENSRIPFSILRISNDLKNKDFLCWLSNKSKMSVDLPNSLFDNALEKELSEKLNKNNISFNNSDKFSVRLCKLLKGDTQPFYQFRRVYKINKEIVKFDISNIDSKTIKAKYGQTVTENEKHIRFIQTQDRVLMLLCKHILQAEPQEILHGDIRLSMIFPFSKNSPLNRPAKFKPKIIKKDQEHYFTIIAEDSQQQREKVESYLKLTADEELINYKGQKGYEWILKDFGRFKKLETDRRLPKLSEYFIDKEVTFDFLQYQLKEYDKYREKIFELTFELERKISDKAFEVLKGIELNHRKGEEKNYNEVQFDKFITLLKDRDILDQVDINKLEYMRNRFSHSEFPDYYPEITKISKSDIEKFEENKFQKGEVEKLNLSLSKKILELYEGITQKVLQEL